MARRRNGRPTVDPSDAPICMTAASLPTEPPPATVRQVPRRMPGVSAAGTRRFLRMFPTTVSVARSTGNLSRRYRRMDAMPRTGSANRSHGKRPEEPAREVHGEREYDGGARSHGADDDGERDVPRDLAEIEAVQGSCRRGLVADGLLPACVAALVHAQLRLLAAVSLSAPWYGHIGRDEGCGLGCYRPEAERFPRVSALRSAA